MRKPNVSLPAYRGTGLSIPLMKIISSCKARNDHCHFWVKYNHPHDGARITLEQKKMMTLCDRASISDHFC